MLQEKDDCKDGCSHFMTDNGSESLGLLSDLLLFTLLHLDYFFSHICCLIPDVDCKCRLSPIVLLSELYCYEAVLKIYCAAGFRLLFQLKLDVWRRLRHYLEDNIL